MNEILAKLIIMNAVWCLGYIAPNTKYGFLNIIFLNLGIIFGFLARKGK